MKELAMTADYQLNRSPVLRYHEPHTVTNSREDELEISSAGRMLDEMTNNSDMRAERLAQIKAAIDDGTYDTDEKLDAALSRMLDQISDSE